MTHAAPRQRGRALYASCCNRFGVTLATVAYCASECSLSGREELINLLVLAGLGLTIHQYKIDEDIEIKDGAGQREDQHDVRAV